MVENLVWYAAYGSNVSRERFMLYLQGGTLPRSNRRYQGCVDKSPPRADRAYKIPHDLYFAKCSGTWDGAVAFVESSRTEVVTLGRIYLVTFDQFNDVVRQENGCCPGGPSLTLDSAYLEGKEECFLNPEDFSKPANQANSKWYGRILRLGTLGEFPVLTCTAEWAGDQILSIVNASPAPSCKYLLTIARGLAETYKGLTLDDAVNYFSDKRGVKSRLTASQIRKWIVPAFEGDAVR